MVMVRCCYNKMGMSVEHIWFVEDIHIQSKADILYFHGVKTNESIVGANIQHSLITDLLLDQDVLLDGIGKNYRYEIRRANNEGIEFRTYSGKELLNNIEILDSFENVYNEMYKSKGMKDKFNKNLVMKYIDCNAIVVTAAFYEGKPLVFHSYIMNQDFCRLYQSASPFRQEKEISVVIGRMNKALHWYDIMMFKGLGLKQYDWGGIQDPQNPNGIDKFKMAFGGKAISYYNIIRGNTLRGKLALQIKKLN